MKVHLATAIYFSPTGTTKKIIHAVIRGMGIVIREQIDLTSPQARSEVPVAITGDIVFIGVPVYGLGIPKILYPFLAQLHGNHQPAVLIAVYGNVSAGIALNELSAFAEKAGFKPVAAASFIGEHSISTGATPVAQSRPDRADLERAGEFGRDILKKIAKIDDLAEISLKIPQSKVAGVEKFLTRVKKRFTPDNGTKLFTQTPRVDLSLCSHCEICVDRCPVAAINRYTLAIDETCCFHCFSCVKRCPKKARKIIYRPQRLVAKVMAAKTKIERQPEIYL